MLVVGLLCIVGGSHLLIGSATAIAREVGISEWVIGVTIVAAGTSAPELATSLRPWSIIVLARQTGLLMKQQSFFARRYLVIILATVFSPRRIATRPVEPSARWIR